MAEDAVLNWLAVQARLLRRLTAAHPLASNALLCAGILAVSYIGLRGQDRLGPQTVTFGALLCLPLMWRRQRPELCFASTALVAVAQWLISPPQLADAALLIGLYCVADQAGSGRVALALGVAEAGAVAATVKWAVVDPVKIWVGLSAVVFAAAGAGIVMRQRRELVASLHERADRLEQERDQQGRRAAAAERARIAREMHDIVSHNLTVMIALADGAGYALSSSPDQVAPAVERISATGRQALSEMRRLLGVLRDQPAAGALEPQPSLARLDELISQVEAAGIPVAVSIDGDPARLSEGVQLTVFRVAQEALTNTLKHAVAPTQATLALRCDPGGTVSLEVADDGRTLTPVGAGVHPTAQGAGRGLPGMRERAAAYDGRLEAGPLPDGGWRVCLALDA